MRENENQLQKHFRRGSTRYPTFFLSARAKTGEANLGCYPAEESKRIQVAVQRDSQLNIRNNSYRGFQGEA